MTSGLQDKTPSSPACFWMFLNGGLIASVH